MPRNSSNKWLYLILILLAITIVIVIALVISESNPKLPNNNLNTPLNKFRTSGNNSIDRNLNFINNPDVNYTVNSNETSTNFPIMHSKEKFGSRNFQYSGSTNHVAKVLNGWRDSTAIRNELEEREETDEENFGIVQPYYEMNNEIVYPKHFYYSTPLNNPSWLNIYDLNNSGYTDYYNCNKNNDLILEVSDRFGPADSINVDSYIWYPRQKDIMCIYERLIVKTSDRKKSIIGSAIIKVPEDKQWLFSGVISYIQYDHVSNLISIQAGSMEALTILFFIIFKLLIDTSFRNENHHCLAKEDLLSTLIKQIILTSGRKNIYDLEKDNLTYLKQLNHTNIDSMDQIISVP